MVDRPNQPPTANEVRDLIAPLDEMDRKVLGGLTAVLMADPQRVRDGEWVSEQFVQLAIVAHHGDDPEQAAHATTEDVERVRAWAQSRRDTIVNAAVAVFVRVAQELQGRGAFNFEDAQAIVRSYLK